LKVKCHSRESGNPDGIVVGVVPDPDRYIVIARNEETKQSTSFLASNVLF
jgi:hypothetical protein